MFGGWVVATCIILFFIFKIGRSDNRKVKLKDILTAVIVSAILGLPCGVILSSCSGPSADERDIQEYRR